MAEDDRSGTKANWSLGPSIVSLVASIAGVFVGGGQLSAARDQVQDARNFFAQSGPVLAYEAAVQFDFVDSGKKDPDPQNDTTHPRINRRDIQTYDGVYLQVIVTNIGRAETAITDGAIVVTTAPSGASTTDQAESGPGTAGPDAPATPEPDGDNVERTASSNAARQPATTTLIRPASCSNQGGTRVPCDASTALPYKLVPGNKYYLYFSIKENYQLFQRAELDRGFPVSITASGVAGGGITFRTSTILEL